MCSAEDFALGEGGEKDEHFCDKDLEMVTNKLSFCSTCSPLCEEMYRVCRKFGNLANKNSLLSKSLNEQFCFIGNQESNYLESEIKCESNIEEECIFGDPLRIEEDVDIDSSEVNHDVKEEYDNAGNICSEGEEVNVYKHEAFINSGGKTRRYSLRNNTKSRECEKSGTLDAISDGSAGEELYSELRDLDCISEDSAPSAKRVKSVKVKRKVKRRKRKSADSKGYTVISIENSATKHIKSHYRCNECGKVFPSIWSITFHLLDHKDDHQLTVYTENVEGPPYQCPKCVRSCPRVSHLKMHCLRVHNLKVEVQLSKPTSEPLTNNDAVENDSLFPGSVKGPPFECPKCEAKWTKRAHLSIHLNKVHNLKLTLLRRAARKLSKELKCVECSVNFETAKGYLIHQRRRHKKKYFHCVVCYEMFEHEADLEHHMESGNHNGQLEKNIIEEEEIQDSCNEEQEPRKFCDEPFFCRECNFGFKTRRSVANHLHQAHQSRNKFDCKACEEHFNDSTDLLRHLENIHQEIARPEIRRNTFRCDECPNTIFASFNVLKQHLSQSNHQSPSITCSFCDKQFSDMEALSSHKRIDHENILKEIQSKEKCTQSTIRIKDNVCKCTFCEKTFLTVQKMCRHRDTHPKDEQIYKCTQCPKTYTLYNSLQQHFHNLHSEETFQCSDCGKTIVGVRQFRKHCLRHSEIASGVKPLCDLCGKSFVTKLGLVKHKNVFHLGKEQKKCHICGYVSPTKWYMNYHMKVHAKNGSIKKRKNQGAFVE